MGRLSDTTRQQNETSIRAAIERLLRGEIPPGGKCDIKTLAAEAGVTRTGFYPKGERPGPYQHLAEEFERRLQAVQQTGGDAPDPRAAQIARLKHENTRLRERIAERDATIADLGAFKTMAVSRLAAQHDELERLRETSPHPNNIRHLPTRDGIPTIGPS